MIDYHIILLSIDKINANLSAIAMFARCNIHICMQSIRLSSSQIDFYLWLYMYSNTYLTNHAMCEFLCESKCDRLSVIFIN